MKWIPTAVLVAALSACGGGDGSGSSPPPSPGPTPPSPAVNGPAWPTFGGNAQHTAVSGITTPALNRIVWQTSVDLNPQYAGGQYLLAHYGSPVITSKNTVIVPVKTGAQGGFRLEAHDGASGALMWTLTSDYVPPPHNWFPSFNAVVTPNARAYIPGIAGRVYFMPFVDDAGPRTAEINQAIFYGAATPSADLAALLTISTPLTADAAGNVYFGFYVAGANAANLQSGIARVTPDGSGTWQAATVLANDANVDRVAMNSAPALSTDGTALYVAVSDAQEHGYLLRLDSATLAAVARIPLLDPKSGLPARITGDSTASPAVAPDGDVYYGVLESTNRANNSRGWLLHFNAMLTQAKTPGAFGWDNTPSVIPSSAVPGYAGTSTYLLASKYNNYAGSGTGDGQNRMAILDPSAPHTDAISGVITMSEVLTILGPTPDAGNPGGVREWCVNTGAFDPGTRSMLINNEDGYLYRWDLSTNQLSQRIRFNNGIGQSYTPTAVGADGTVYAINNAVLFAVGR